jgi:hypothetical protein
VCTEWCTARTFLTLLTQLTRLFKPFRDGQAGQNGRYWARTSDPQLVELVLSQLS